MRPAAQILALITLLVTTSGCGALWRGPASTSAVAPSGLPWGEELVRRALVMGTYDQALARTAERGDGAPNDDLLRALFHGQAAYYAGEWEQSTAAFAEADRLTEARYTKSASRGLLSLLGNDRVLRYVPARTERLFSPYYAMMARMQSGDVAGAVVDARRLSALLEASANDLDPSERPTHAALRDVAGAVFEAGGEWNDAGVAYRNAALLRGAARESLDAIVASAPTGDSATVFVVVEGGFVAHYVAESVAFPVGGVSGGSRKGRTGRADGRRSPDQPDSWLAALDAEPDGGVFASADGETAALGDGTPLRSVAAAWTPARRRDRRYLGGRGWGGAWLEVSWPALVRPRLPTSPVRLIVSGRSALSESAAPDSAWEQYTPVPYSGASVAEISDAVGADARRLRGPRLARLAARTVTRVAAVDAVQEKHGQVAGAILGLVASSIERADTRGWHLLPGRLSIVRLRVPAGPVKMALRVGSLANPAPVDLPAFTAQAGAAYVRTARVWRDPAGTPTLAQGSGQGDLSLPH